jgi:pimeloyl-ACP methyl ester carboxylesterase
MYDDAEYIAELATELADQGKDIVLMSHSYGGTPASQSMKGLSRSERAKAGKKGGVVRLAYMTALVPEEGVPAGGAMADPEQDAPQENASAMVPDEVCVFDLLKCKHPLIGNRMAGSFNRIPRGSLVWFSTIYPSMKVSTVQTRKDISLRQCNLYADPRTGIAAAQKFSQHSSVSFANPLTYPGYKDVPVSYLFCEEDECVSTRSQQKGIDVAEAASGKKVDVKRIPSDHCPTYTHPEMALEWMISMADKGGEE